MFDRIIYEMIAQPHGVSIARLHAVPTQPQLDQLQTQLQPNSISAYFNFKCKNRAVHGYARFSGGLGHGMAMHGHAHGRLWAHPSQHPQTFRKPHICNAGGGG